jgi:hypothetical protein
LGHHAQRDRSKHGARGNEGEKLGHGMISDLVFRAGRLGDHLSGLVQRGERNRRQQQGR